MNICRLCLYYNHGEKTCGRSAVRVSNGKPQQDYATIVRLDKNRCGPQAKWFAEKKEPAEELLESIDI